MKIIDIKSPQDIKALPKSELPKLASDIREFLLDSVSKTGGHLSSNLGVVELTIALHYVFDAPKDKILFDVGHQCYVHKILTGRAKDMAHLRQLNGIAGFQKRVESEYDCFEAGHSSTALSTALGMAIARDLQNDTYSVVPVVGDGAIMSGMSFEALNQIGYKRRKLIIVFNDNNMSINKNVGALKKSFSKLRTNESYTETRDNVKGFLNQSKIGETIQKGIHDIKESFKRGVIDSGIFKEFNIDYIGPIDGHNINDLIKAFYAAKRKDLPCVVHVITKKGKGYKYTEEDRVGKWHGVGKFDKESGKPLSKLPEGYLDYSSIVSNAVEKIMDENKDVVCITPAMITGSKLNNIFNKYPDRSFDVGIAEDHAICFASGFALNGKHPFVSIYSSFLQRAYDQINHDIARMKLPVVIGVDRAGLVGEDGETHHGVFDISILRSIPNVIITQGKNSIEIENLIYTGFKQNCPFFVRYPRGSIEYTKNYKFEEIEVGKWENLNNNKDIRAYILSYGEDVIKIANYINNKNLPYAVINCRFIKPIDTSMLDLLFKKKKPLFVYTTDIIKGGLGDEILEYKSFKDYKSDVYIYGINDIYVTHGTQDELKKMLSIDLNSLFKDIKEKLNAKKS